MLFLVAVYVGYFGAAGGILMLAVLIPMLSQSLARTNAVKNVINGLANGVAAVGFAAFGPVRWAAVLPLGAGFLIGGWIGPALVRRIPGRLLQILIALARHRPGHPARPEHIPLTRTAAKPTYVGLGQARQSRTAAKPTYVGLGQAWLSRRRGPARARRAAAA